MPLDEAAKPYIRYLFRFIICALACEMVWIVRIAVGSFKCRRELKEHLKTLNAWKLETQELRRRSRQRNANANQDLSDGRLCVICSTNVLEVILLPCGHVCLCKDCSAYVNFTCPVCRSTIRRKHRAYIC